MADEQQPDTSAPSEDTTSQSSTQSPSNEQDTVEYWRGRSRQHEDREKQLRSKLKELEPKAAELDKLNESNKSEMDKLAESNQQLSTQADQAQHELERVRAAIRAGADNPESFAARLNGASADELDTDAAELMQLLSATANGNGAAPREPERKSDPSQGATPAATGPADKLAEFINNKRR